MFLDGLRNGYDGYGMGDRGESLYTLDNGFHRPNLIDEMGKDAVAKFDRAMGIAHDAEQ